MGIEIKKLKSVISIRLYFKGNWRSKRRKCWFNYNSSSSYFRKPSSITTDTLQGKKIIELIKNDISLYASHTNLDSVENGLNHTIVSILGFNDSIILEKNNRDDSAGLGRLVSLDEEISLEELVSKIKVL